MTVMRILLLIGAAAIVVTFLFRRFSVRPSQLTVQANDVHFPAVSGSNLDRKEMVFPRDFEGEVNLLFVPFLQEQQLVVNTWIPFAEELESSMPGLVYYELPTIQSMPAVSRTFINEGMRAGIPDPKARQRTITLYIDLDSFMAATEIDGRNDVHTLLVDRNGAILWRTTGVYDAEKGEELRRTLADHGS